MCPFIRDAPVALKLHLDRLRWYCRAPAHTTPIIIKEDAFHVHDLGKQLAPLIRAWQADAELRKCKECGAVADPQ